MEKFDRGLYSYIVKGENAKAAVDYLEEHFRAIDNENISAGYEINAAEDRSAVIEKCKELFCVEIELDI